jgi:uncharacterized protein YoaH (UPF0181 family)
MILETKLIERINKKLDDEDERAKEIMAAGLLSSFEAYKSYAARRKALHDTKQIVNETFEEIMKE